MRHKLCVYLPAELVSKTCAGAHLSVVWKGGQGLRERCHAGFELVLRDAGVDDEHVCWRHDIVRGHLILNRGKLVIELRHLLLHGWTATSVQGHAMLAHALPQALWAQPADPALQGSHILSLHMHEPQECSSTETSCLFTPHAEFCSILLTVMSCKHEHCLMHSITAAQSPLQRCPGSARGSGCGCSRRDMSTLVWRSLC